ncbi:MAG: hypothetical protein U0T81_05450 [Saprospiraceae bacterium]
MTAASPWQLGSDHPYIKQLNDKHPELRYTYTWNGNSYTNSGTYTFKTQNAEGCEMKRALH